MPKLLVIDDDLPTREYIKEFFEQRKYMVLCADSGEKGLGIITQEKPDLVLLDVNMGGMSGLEVLKAIKSSDPGIAVIMVTVASDNDTREKAKKYGADDFIRKPIQRDYLEGTVLLKVAALIRERKVKNLPKILVVDDEVGLREGLGQNLMKHIECEAILAADGYEALKIFESTPIDLILLDIRMPGISGTDVIKKIREKNKDVPIFVISAWEGSAVGEHVWDIGADEYFPKPAAIKFIREKVAERLKKMGRLVLKWEG